mmetsp:Transcript_93263/g.216762  ORF Transcript_93263/g.216762 Transcript_93263/m.216762 type:complete len:337 (+) Transcript_93263:39-1049(+)
MAGCSATSLLLVITPLLASAICPDDSAACSGVQPDELPALATELLQHTLQLEQPLQFSAEATPLLEATKPLRWLHVPKTGSSWINVLIHTPSMCPFLPHGIVVDKEQFCQSCDDTQLGILEHFYLHFNTTVSCPGSFGSPENPPYYHRAIGSRLADYAGHGLTMLRNPESRMASSWHYMKWDWPHLGNRPPRDLEDYKNVTQGCYVRALTFETVDPPYLSFCHIKATLDNGVSPESVKEAKRRLDTLVFVGITEEWDLSVCLWRVMFGGLCYGSDMEKIRASPEPYTVDLGGFIDKADHEIYEHGQKIFERNKMKYGVSRSSCQPCFEHARTHWAP